MYSIPDYIKNEYQKDIIINDTKDIIININIKKNIKEKIIFKTIIIKNNINKIYNKKIKKSKLFKYSYNTIIYIPKVTYLILDDIHIEVIEYLDIMIENNLNEYNKLKIKFDIDNNNKIINKKYIGY